MTARLPEYPQAVPLEKQHKPLFDAAFGTHPPSISEFTFTNLFAWRKSYGLSVSSVGEYILLRSDSSKGRAFFPLIGPAGAQSLMRELLRETGIPFIRVPRHDCQGLGAAEGASVQEDRDSFDYVYAVKDLVELAGRKYDGKRNLIKKFKATYLYEYRELQGALLGDCLAFHDEWCVAKDCASDDGLQAESVALREIIAHYKEFNLTGGAITVDGGVRAFAIAEALNAQTLVVHLLKAHADVKGLYQFMLNEFLARGGLHYEFVNLEQDLGIEGLRKAKESYYPRHLVKKYTVRVLENHV